MDKNLSSKQMQFSLPTGKMPSKTCVLQKLFNRKFQHIMRIIPISCSTFPSIIDIKSKQDTQI